MRISGCTACQLGGVEGLQAYDRAYQRKQSEDAARTAQLAAGLTPVYPVNQPLPGATVGGCINIRV